MAFIQLHTNITVNFEFSSPTDMKLATLVSKLPRKQSKTPSNVFIINTPQIVSLLEPYSVWNVILGRK